MTFDEAKHFLDPNNLFLVGKILKPHSYKGQVKVDFRFDPYNFSEESVIVDVYGWLVPFFIDYSKTNLEALVPIVKFFLVDTEEQALEIAHRNIYLPFEQAKKYLDVDSIFYLIGYKMIDKESGKELKIVDYQDIKKNPTVIVADEHQNTWVVPVNAADVESIDHKNKSVEVRLPKGLIE